MKNGIRFSVLILVVLFTVACSANEFADLDTDKTLETLHYRVSSDWNEEKGQGMGGQFVIYTLKDDPNAGELGIGVLPTDTTLDAGVINALRKADAEALAGAIGDSDFSFLDSLPEGIDAGAFLIDNENGVEYRNLFLLAGDHYFLINCQTSDPESSPFTVNWESFVDALHAST